MSLFSWFKPKTVDDIFDKDDGLLTKAGEWIGNQQFTDEERAETNTGNIIAIQKFVVDTLSENTDRSKARREVAVFFIKFYALLVFMAGMTYIIDPGWSKVWFDLATSLGVAGLVSAISIFFFGSHAVSRYKDSKND